MSFQDAQEWLVKSAEDEEMARRALAGKALPAPALFHSQQAVEKALKGFLFAFGVPFVRQHNLMALLHELRRVNRQLATRLRKFCVTLDGYAVTPRYPGSPASLPEAQLAIRNAGIVCKQVRKALSRDTVATSKRQAEKPRFV